MRKIDIAEIIEHRTGRRLPKMVATLLARIIHQRELNEILSSGYDLGAADFIRHTLRYLNVKYNVTQTTPIDPQGRYIFVSNHPFGGLDGMIIADALSSMFPDVGVVANDMLMNIDPLRSLWIPVNKYGRQSAEKSQTYHEAFGSPTKQILTFPAGYCSRMIGGSITDTPWRERFVKDAANYNRQVVPIYVDGRLSKRFYRIYSIRKALHINLNIELLLLIDEMFRQRGRTIEIIVGRPVNINADDTNVRQCCERMRNEVYALKDTLLTDNKVL